MNPDELAEILRKHSAWWNDEGGGEKANLSGANLRGANLRGADLSQADLGGADLGGANLRGADLSEADLRGADLGGADLREANLSGADLRGADLYGADLDGANLDGADLYGADLSDADLSGADLRGADLLLIGQDVRGYLFYAYATPDGVIEIRAGCRRFTGIAAARAHWEQRHLDNLVLHADCLSLVQRAETMAIARGWKLEPDAQPQPGQEGDNE